MRKQARFLRNWLPSHKGLEGSAILEAHPHLGELTKSEVGLLADLARAILEYVYTAPYLAEKAARTLASIKGGPTRSKKSVRRK